MKTATLGILVLLAAIMVFPTQVLSNSEERFGPWVYYAPYYFPPDGCCLGYCFSADELIPRYESANPPQPRNDAPPRCDAPPPRHPSKVAARPGEASSEAPRPVPVARPRGTDRDSTSSAVSKRPFPPGAARPEAGSSRSAQTSGTLRSKQDIQPRLVSPPGPGSQGR